MKRPGEAGFTLVEALIALTVLALGLLGLWKLHIATFRSDALTHRAYTAMQLANRKAEELKVQGYSSLAPGTNADCCDRAADNCTASCAGQYYRREWVVDTPPGAIPDAWRVTIQVGWGGTGCASTLSNCDYRRTLVTLVSDF